MSATVGMAVAFPLRCSGCGNVAGEVSMPFPTAPMPFELKMMLKPVVKFLARKFPTALALFDAIASADASAASRHVAPLVNELHQAGGLPVMCESCCRLRDSLLQSTVT